MSSTGSGTMKRSGSLRFDTARLRRNIQKHISRTKERVMHNLDKGEKTEDEFIRRSETVLMKKQATTVKLQTELKRHLKALKNVSASTRSLHETMLEAYEDTWAGRKEFADALVNLDSCWLHYFNSLCTVLEQVGNHMDEFVNLKEKLEKRKRKLVDYNLAKRNLHLVSSSKKKDENKLKKARRDVEFVEVAYHELNAELRTELPTFYDGHVHFCCENWSYLLENEKNMYEILCSTVQKFISSLDQLRTGYEQSEYHLSGVEVSFSDISRSSLSLAAEPTYANGDLYEDLDSYRPRVGSIGHHRYSSGGSRNVHRHASSANHIRKPHNDFPSNRSQSVDDMTVVDDGDGYASFKFSSHDVSKSPSAFPNPLKTNSARSMELAKKRNAEAESDVDGEDHIYAEVDRSKKVHKKPVIRKVSAKEGKKEEQSKGLPNDAASSTSSSFSTSLRLSIDQSTNSGSPRPEKPRRSENLPMMIVVHPYISQDEDELDLAIDDLVQVLPWENESLKEDGWLFGMKLPDSKKGLFPENHTTMLVT